ncbi:Succinate--hydroxymethylglutarate CoA-transferase [Lasiodiplodia hormozganensis]|uniref:Succinate--hydroxymethylglutarate CoA-transferase n=1 Tax=Lasiodiplodia hormozganensis TaxID=869390 RepID=A0AA39WAI1_9PEZI|nr:Succinate--hydroxymethylglutarate CoA-transferase [Lasiodiplodia hormozganensis]
MAADASDSSTVHSKPPATTNINIIHEGISTDRSRFTPHDVIADIWASLGLPAAVLPAIDLPGSENAGPVLPSSYRIGCLAQSSIALSALSAALVHSVRNASVRKAEEKEKAAAASLPRITVPQRHATAEFLSVQHCSIVTPNDDDASPQPPRARPSPVLDIHPTAEERGRIRIHTAFPHHRDGALRLLGLDPAAYRTGNLTRADIDAQTRQWRSRDLEAAGLAAGCAMYALRSYGEWDGEAQASVVADVPVRVRRIGGGVVGVGAGAGAGRPGSGVTAAGRRRCLTGLRVLELTRVIAGPVAGRTLAAHGADVLWVTAPHLPALPVVDRDVARGKRTAQLDLRREDHRERLRELVAGCDVFLQGYRPGSLAARGWEEEDLVRMNPGIVVANMSAFGPEGPWQGRRGFDSLVQTCSGMNVSEAEHFNGGEQGEVARVLPCQALDHASGYLLATGICAALYKREVEGGGGAFCVDVSLAGTMKYLRSLGQFEGRSGFDCAGFTADEVEGYLEVRESGLGVLKAVRHSASVEGFETGWDRMPKPLGSDEAEWQS